MDWAKNPFSDFDMSIPVFFSRKYYVFVILKNIKIKIKEISLENNWIYRYILNVKYSFRGLNGFCEIKRYVYKVHL